MEKQSSLITLKSIYSDAYYTGSQCFKEYGTHLGYPPYNKTIDCLFSWAVVISYLYNI